MPDPGLIVHYVWTPVLTADDRKAALEAALKFADERAHHWWDAGRKVAYRMAKALGISPEDSLEADSRGIAWDVYLAYGRGTDLGETPDFWMHQLEVKHAPRLDPEVWRVRVESLLSGR